MAIRISETHDAMIIALMSGTGMDGAAVDTLLQNVRTHLDENYAGFLNSEGQYTNAHVKRSLDRVLARGK